jgi:hypothetical protein
MKAILKDGRVLDVVLGKGWGVLCTDGATEYIYTLGLEIDKIVPDKIEKGSLLSKDIDWQQVEIQSAIAAMQALISKESGGYVAGYTTLDLAERAVGYANSLVVVLREKDVNV